MSGRGLLPDMPLDAVISASAFHWLDPHVRPPGRHLAWSVCWRMSVRWIFGAALPGHLSSRCSVVVRGERDRSGHQMVDGAALGVAVVAAVVARTLGVLGQVPVERRPGGSSATELCLTAVPMVGSTCLAMFLRHSGGVRISDVRARACRTAIAPRQA